MECGHLATFRPKSLLMQEGNPAHHVFGIASGTVCVSTLLPDGRRQVFGFARSGDFLGVLAEDQYPCTACAVDEVSTLRMDRMQMREMVARNPQLLAALQEITSCELALARKHIVLLGRRSAAEKVAGFILEHQAHSSTHNAHDHADVIMTRVDLPMTRQDVADYLGLTLETVCRTLTWLARSGLIFIIPRGVRILDRARLAEIAVGDDGGGLDAMRHYAGARGVPAERRLSGM